MAVLEQTAAQRAAAALPECFFSGFGGGGQCLTLFHSSHFAVSTLEFLDLPVHDLPDLVGGFGHEITVVAYQHQAAFVFAEASMSISTELMSRWLVGSSSSRKLAWLMITLPSATTRFFAAGKDADLFEHVIALEQEAAEQ